MIPSFKQYLVEEEREIFFTFGRMNPPTIGHGKLMDVLSRKAGKNPYKVFLSHSQDAKKNPLTYQQKVKHARKMFPKHSRSVMMNTKIKTVFDAAVNLYDQGFKRINMVVGADRITEFETLLNKYNAVKGKHGFYNFESIKIISAGDRDPDAEGVEGMSASKQRQNAANNDFTTFVQGVPSSMSNKDVKKLFNDIRVGMGLKESKNFKMYLDLGKLNDTREKYVAGELFEPGDRVIVKESKQKGYIYRLGANYVIVALDEGRVSRQWLDGIVLEKTDRWYKSQPEWGTPESTNSAKKLTPGQQEEDLEIIDAVDPVKIAKDKIGKEKQSDKIKHDRILDRVRLARARARNAQTKPDQKDRNFRNESADKMNGVSFDPRSTITFRKRNTEATKNPVAKHAHKFNKAKVEPDKKKEVKKGYTKHKKNYK